MGIVTIEYDLNLRYICDKCRKNQGPTTDAIIEA